MTRRLLAWMLTGLFALNAAAIEIRDFKDPAQQARYERLIEQLRCLVCQNQSLADSDADLAKDLRSEVYEIVTSGQSDAEAIAFLTDRYGDFVLYDPPVKGLTLLLWGGPILLFLSGTLLLWQIQKRTQDPAPLNDQERRKLNALKAALKTPKDRPS